MYGISEGAEQKQIREERRRMPILDMLRCRNLRNKQEEMSSRYLAMAGTEHGRDTWEPLARQCPTQEGPVEGAEVGLRKA